MAEALVLLVRQFAGDGVLEDGLHDGGGVLVEEVLRHTTLWGVVAEDPDLFGVSLAGGRGRGGDGRLGLGPSALVLGAGALALRVVEVVVAVALSACFEREGKRILVRYE